MNWDDLKVVLAVAESGSLNGAARQLGVNHSTVFRRLNALEKDLGARLFERLPSGYVLTPGGERTVELAHQADDVLQTIEREVAGRDLSPSGKVRVTTAPNIARVLLPKVLLELRRSHPGIIVEIAVGDSDYDLNRREADIALRATTSPPGYLIGRKLLDLNWWVIGSSALRRYQPADTKALADCPLIGADKALLRLPVFEWLESGYHDSIVARANDLSTMAAMVRAGVGLGLLPSDQAEQSLRRHFKVPGMQGQLWLLTHPDLRQVRRIRVVWEQIIASLCPGDNKE